MRGTSWVRRVASVVGTLLLVTALAACGGDDDDTAAGDDTTTTEAADDTTTTTAEPAQAVGVELVATDYAYAVAGGEAGVPAGPIEISLRNDGAEEHQATVISFKPGKGLGDLAAVGTDPKQLYDVVDGWGGPNVVAPGSTVAATVDLGAGEYAYICFIPSPDGTPHAAKGMLTPFTVVPPTAQPADMLDAVFDGALALKDYEFQFSEGFGGAGQLVVENAGPQAHELAIYRLDEGTTVADAAAYLQAPEGTPPYTSVTGIAPMNAGQRNLLTVDLTPGQYMLICFLPDVSDGAPHYTKGMAQPLNVT